MRGPVFVSSKWSHTRPIFWLIHIYSHVRFLWGSCSFMLQAVTLDTINPLQSCLGVIVWPYTSSICGAQWVGIFRVGRWLDNTCWGFPGTTWCKPDSHTFVESWVGIMVVQGKQKVHQCQRVWFSSDANTFIEYFHFLTTNPLDYILEANIVLVLL